MGYYNYHAQAKKRIKDGHLIGYEYVPEWNRIKPALVLYFDDHKPMPIREIRWNEYEELFLFYDAKEKRLDK